MKVAILGANGQLGSALTRALDGRAMPFSHADLDITWSDNMIAQTIWEEGEPDWIVNCAAAHRVDELESCPNKALSVNALGAYNVAWAARNIGAGVVYISTDYVFGHNGPWYEGDAKGPLNTYGVSKVAGEDFTKAYAPRWLIVRTSTLFGGPKSFVSTMLSLSKKNNTLTVTDDRVMSPSYAPDVACKIVQLLESEENIKRGQGFHDTCHITNIGSCTFKQFTEEIFARQRLAVKVLPGKAEDRDIAVRPRNSVLKHGFLNWYNMDNMRPWQEALSEYLQGIV